MCQPKRIQKLLDKNILLIIIIFIWKLCFAVYKYLNKFEWILLKNKSYIIYYLLIQNRHPILVLECKSFSFDTIQLWLEAHCGCKSRSNIYWEVVTLRSHSVSEWQANIGICSTRVAVKIDPFSTESMLSFP